MTRNIAILAHTGRTTILKTVQQICHTLHKANINIFMLPKELKDLQKQNFPNTPTIKTLNTTTQKNTTIELTIAVGGDGTILRAAEQFHTTPTPILGINLGRLGFLATEEPKNLQEIINQIINQKYNIEHRSTIETKITNNHNLIGKSWALNEISIEKNYRATILEILLKIDSHPLTIFNCDGIIIATPTGSTAYAFSAGGPVMWPEVDALIAIPMNAHSLFSKPLILGPQTTITIEILNRTHKNPILWGDSRRNIEIPLKSTIEISKSATTIPLAQLHTTPFSRRLINKFNISTNNETKNSIGNPHP